MASSQPASQLLQSDAGDETQETNGHEGAEEPEADVEITPERLQVFQAALGQLIDGPLFANDAADVEPLIAAINARVGDRFSSAEAESALEELNDRNKIM